MTREVFCIKKRYNLIKNFPHGPKISTNVYTHINAIRKSQERFLSSEVSYNELRIPGSLTESIACFKQMSSSLKQHITMRTIQMQVTCQAAFTIFKQHFDYNSVRVLWRDLDL